MWPTFGGLPICVPRLTTGGFAKEEGRCLDPRLVQIWRDFGDLYRYETFTHWWVDRGEALFTPGTSVITTSSTLWSCLLG